MSGPKCDMFSLSEEEVQRQQEEQARLLLEEQRKIREEQERRRREEEKRKREEEEKKRRRIAADAEDTLQLLKALDTNPLKEEFQETYCEYRAAAVIAKEVAEEFEYSETNASLVIAKMCKDIEAWKEKSLLRSCAKRVNELIDETIEEMGYELIGEKTNEKEDQPMAKLYQYDENTAISVISLNGQFTMEVVERDDVDRAATEEEAEQLETHMEEFCEDYEKLKERLAAKQVIHSRNVFHMPPDKAYARIVNTSAYRTKRKHRTYSEDYMKETTQKNHYGQKKV